MQVILCPTGVIRYGGGQATPSRKEPSLRPPRHHRTAPELLPSKIPWEGKLAGRAEADLIQPPTRGSKMREVKLMRAFERPSGAIGGASAATTPGGGIGQGTALDGGKVRQGLQRRSAQHLSAMLPRTGADDPYEQCLKYGVVDQCHQYGEIRSAFRSQQRQKAKELEREAEEAKKPPHLRRQHRAPPTRRW